MAIETTPPRPQGRYSGLKELKQVMTAAGKKEAREMEAAAEKHARGMEAYAKAIGPQNYS